MNLEKLLKKEKEDIENMLLEVETYIEKCDKVLNTYHLTCSSSHGTSQYLLNGSYVSKKDLSMVKLVAQLDYYKQIVIELKKRERVINRVLKQCDNSKLDQIYLHQCEGRRKIVTDIRIYKERHNLLIRRLLFFRLSTLPFPLLMYKKNFYHHPICHSPHTLHSSISE